MCRDAEQLRPFKVAPAQAVPDHIPKPAWWHGKPIPDNLPFEIHDEEVRAWSTPPFAAAVALRAGVSPLLPARSLATAGAASVGIA